MSEQAPNNSSNIIGKGTQLDGNLTSAGNLRVEGKVKGNIETKVKVVLGDTSVVEGEIKAQNAEIGGEVHGAIRIAGLLILKPTAVVHGDIIASKLVFEEGAKFNGKCNMGGAVKDSKPNLSANINPIKTGGAIETTKSATELPKKGQKSVS